MRDYSGHSTAARHYFADLTKEVEFLIEGAAQLNRQPEIKARLKYLKTVARDLEEFVAKEKVSYEDAKFSFENELKDFIAFLDGRLD